MSKPAEKVAEDLAAGVNAPGQESFKTPDLQIPSEVSEDPASQFGGDIDWEDALDNENDADVDDEGKAVNTSPETTDSVVPLEDEPQAKEESSETPEPVDESVAAISDEDAAAAVVTESDEDFQPEAIQDFASEKGPDEDWRKEYNDQRTAAVDELVNKYQMTEEDRDEFVLNPEKVIPRLAANLYVDVFESVLGAVNQMLPDRVANIQGVSLQAEQYTNDFYDAWPALKTAEGQKEVLRVGKLYRGLNMEATPQEFIRDVGTQVSVQMRIPIPGITEAEPPASEETPAFVPGGAGNSGAELEIPKDPRQSDNQFERLNAEWEDD